MCIAKQKIYDSLGSSGTNVLRAAVVKIGGKNVERSIDLIDRWFSNQVLLV